MRVPGPPPSSLELVKVSEAEVVAFCRVIVIAYFYVQLPGILFVLLASDRAVDFFTRERIEVSFRVEDSLRPMSSLLVGAGGEHDWFGQVHEGRIPPGDNPINIIGEINFELVLRGVLQIILAAVEEVKVEDFARFRHDLVWVKNAYLGLKCGVLRYATHVNSVQVVPKSCHFLLMLTVLDGRYVKLGFVGKHASSRD